MQVVKALMLGLTLLAVPCLAAEAPFYYSGGVRNPLLIDSAKVTLQFQANVSAEQQQLLLSRIGRVGTVLDDKNVIHGFVVCSLVNRNEYSSFLDSLIAIPEIQRVEPYYLINDTTPLLVGASFCVGFEEKITRHQIDSINALFRVEITGQPGSGGNRFYLKSVAETSESVLALSNRYYELPETFYAHPNFSVPGLQDSPYTLYDYYNEYQWHIKKVIGDFNERSVWDFAGLDSPAIRIAVIDDGVAPHEDLPADRLVSSVNLAEDGGTGGPMYSQWHGQGCAGIIAASHSTEGSAASDPQSGVISLNPWAEIVSIRVFGEGQGCGGVPDSTWVAAIFQAWSSTGSDILSCSWHTAAVIDELTVELNAAVAGGRDNRGCPVIFSAGNFLVLPGGGPVYYPARLDSCIAVGAINANDERWWYSNYGSSLDLVAPSGNTGSFPIGDVWSTDVMGGPGVNPNLINSCPDLGNNDAEYNCKFGGTSAAAPVVAGVASLLLARDPNMKAICNWLGMPEFCEEVDYSVYGILKGSAVPLTSTVPDPEYGYGRVDAYRAILSIARGDVNNDAELTLGDAMYLANWLFVGPPAPWPDERLGDVMLLVDHVAISLAPLPLPCFEFDY